MCWQLAQENKLQISNHRLLIQSPEHWKRIPWHYLVDNCLVQEERGPVSLPPGVFGEFNSWSSVCSLPLYRIGALGVWWRFGRAHAGSHGGKWSGFLLLLVVDGSSVLKLCARCARDKGVSGHADQGWGVCAHISISRARQMEIREWHRSEVFVGT